MGQGARPQPLVLCQSGWQRSPMGSSVLGIGLCSATDWGGAYSSCPRSLPARAGPACTQARGARDCPSCTYSGQSLEVGGQVAQQLLHREQQTGTGTHRAAASVQSPWVPLARQSSRLDILPGPRGQELCLCRGWAARPAPASWPRPSDGQFSAPDPPLAHRPAHSRLAQRCPS